MTTFTKKEEQQALVRIQKLKELSKLLARSTNDSASTKIIHTKISITDPAYKRRGLN